MQSCKVISLVYAVTGVYKHARHLAYKGDGGEDGVKMLSTAQMEVEARMLACEEGGRHGCRNVNGHRDPPPTHSCL